jgi:hypothetical protein
MMYILDETWEIDCDQCCEGICTDMRNRSDAENYARSIGWKVARDNGESLHFCGGNCLNEYNAKRTR